MPYISHLLNNKVTDSSDHTVGYLKDVLISAQKDTFAPLKFLVINIPGKMIKFVAYEFVQNFDKGEILLKNLFSKIALDKLPNEQFIYLKKDILDKQIVDLEGTRVVRVNDLRIGYFDRKMSVLAIDSSVRGLFRRLGWDNRFVNGLFKSSLIDWRQAQLLDNGPLQLNTSTKDLSQLHPADLANIVEELDVKQGSNILESLTDTQAAKVLEEVDPNLQNILVKYLGPERSAKILSQMSSDEFVDLIKSFSTAESRAILAKIKGSKVKNLEKLMSYPDNTAGGLMTLDYVTVRPEWTVLEAVEQIKKWSPNFRSIVFVYVTDTDGSFHGVVSLRRILVAENYKTMAELAKSFRSPAALRPSDKIPKIIRLMTRYNLFTAAVVDKEKKLLGIVTIDDVMRQLYPNA
jgi:CBS domain-containing protein